MPEFDLLIRGGTIVDGLRTPAHAGDLAITNGRVAAIGDDLRPSQARKVLDAQGLIVAPGFVDLHTHYDAQVQWDPYCTLSGWHGVTSVAIGNCGFGFAPCRPEDRDRAMLSMTRNEAIPYAPMKAGMLWDWVTFPEFLNTLDRIPKAVNVLSYVPLTPLYAWVMGWQEAKSRRPTEKELQELCRLIREGLDAGACGWSAQVLGPDSLQRDYDGTPMITDLISDEELFTFGRLLAERGEGSIELTYTAPNKDEKQRFAFFEQLAAVTRRPILYQLVIALARDPERHRSRLRWLEDCHRRGLPLYGQGATTRQAGFEFTFEDWNLFDDSPSWREVTIGTPAERKRKMQDPELRDHLRAEWDAGKKPGRGALEAAAGTHAEDMRIEEVVRPELEKYVGLTWKELASAVGKHPVDALLDLVVADDLQTEFIVTAHLDDPTHTAEVANSPLCVPGVSDGGAHLKFITTGSYPTDLLTWLVRDEQAVTLEEAHYKLSTLSAQLGGFRDRGFLKEGAPADVVAYDLNELALLPTEVVHDLPGGDWRRIQRAKGYRYVLVNGEVTLEDGQPTGAFSGKLLRHGAAVPAGAR
jgi:N-acyl-D-amino-acid deacylase